MHLEIAYIFFVFDFFRSAIEILEVEIRDSACNLNTLEEKSSSELNLPTAPDCVKKQEFDMVNVQ
jgi:hypothetical protein